MDGKYVIKRDGRKEKFCFEKIANAIDKAIESTGEVESFGVSPSIVNELEFVDGCIDIEKIQDFVETLLMKNNLYETAKAYIKYRENRRRIRENAEMQRQFINNFMQSDNTANATIDDNSNVSSHNIAVLNSELHKEQNKQTNLYIWEKKIREMYPELDKNQFINDVNTILYPHDLSGQVLMPYCAAISLYPFLNEGLKGLGGLSAKPSNLDSFCGIFINLVFKIASEFKGACLYKDQPLFINNGELTENITAKKFIEENLSNVLKFTNHQGDWEYSECNGYKVLEDGKFVDVKKVYRRKYNDKIYIIKTSDGHIAKVSKDHRFKHLIQGRIIDTKAQDLLVGDTLVMNKDYTCTINYNSKDFKKGWIIGLICGDGSLTQDKVINLSVNYNQEFLGNVCNDYLQELCGITLNKNKGHKCFNYSKHNEQLYKFIHEDIIGNTTYDKHINIEDKSMDYLVGFLDGLFCADGSYTKTHGIAISLTNKPLSENVRNICNKLDITSKLHTLQAKENRKESYYQYIPSKIIKYLKHSLSKIRGREIETSIMDESREIYYYGYNAFVRRTKVSTKKLLSDYLRDNPDFKYKTDVIESIEVIDNDDDYVYEIETSSHWYNCGGFITHNCATPAFFVLMDYFIRKEFGDWYYKDENYIVTGEGINRHKTVKHEIIQRFQQITYSLNQPSAARGNQSIFWNLSFFDKNFFEGMYGTFVFPDGSKPKWEGVNYLQKLYLHWLNQERLKCVMTFPVTTCAMIYKDGEFKDKEFFDFVCQEYSEGNSFFTYISDSTDSLSSCCRLRNKITTKEFNFTNGNVGEMTGSKNVITLDINRIVQQYVLEEASLDPKGTVEEFYNGLSAYLTKILDRVYKYQEAYNELLHELYNKKMYDAYSAGFISLNRQYLTIGVNGLTAAAECLEIECTPNEEYHKFVECILGTIKEQNAKHKTNKLMFNTELVPAESAAIKLYDRDKKDGYWVPEDINLYTSYMFKPYDESVDIFDKIKLHGKMVNDSLDGGIACHINLAEHLTKEQYAKILNYAGQQECSYLTFNVPNCECKDCGFIKKVPFDKCPECGSENVVKYDRIIGYLTAIPNWSRGRQIEQKKRVYSNEIH